MARQLRRFMAQMGPVPIYQRPRTTVPNSEHRVWPYLLRELLVDRPNQVWCTGLTYIPMRRGFPYLVAVTDWATRKVLSWRVPNTMDVEFCIEVLEQALARFGRPEISTPARAARSPRRGSPASCSKQARAFPWTGGTLGGQHFHRTALAQPEIRVRPPTGIRSGLRTARRVHPPGLMSLNSKVFSVCRFDYRICNCSPR